MRKNCVSLRKKLLHKDLNIKDSISEKTEQVEVKLNLAIKDTTPTCRYFYFTVKAILPTNLLPYE